MCTPNPLEGQYASALEQQRKRRYEKCKGCVKSDPKAPDNNEKVVTEDEDYIPLCLPYVEGSPCFIAECVNVRCSRKKLWLAQNSIDYKRKYRALKKEIVVARRKLKNNLSKGNFTKLNRREYEVLIALLNRFLKAGEGEKDD